MLKWVVTILAKLILANLAKIIKKRKVDQKIVSSGTFLKTFRNQKNNISFKVYITFSQTNIVL